MHSLLLFAILWGSVIAAFFYLNVVETYYDSKILEIKAAMIRVDPRAANITYSAGDSSYTIDKNNTYLCLRHKDTKEYYDTPMLIYVALHELAHSISKSVDPNHTSKEFNDNFKMLKMKAKDIGIYDPNMKIDYNYCPQN
jgi:hypothetical protein